MTLASLVLLLMGLFSSPARPHALPSDPARLWTGAETVRDSLTAYYAEQDTVAIDRLYRRKARTEEERLLCLYRLFPMTMDDAYLTSIPSDRGVASARQLSLIAALWAYKAASGPAYTLPTYGRRSERILGQALRLDPNEPYALLVRGQSLYYKPRVFGGNVAEAQRTFEQLRTVLARQRVPGIHPFEADVWIWMCVRKQDEAAGRRMQRELLSRRTPPLFRQFLVSPP